MNVYVLNLQTMWWLPSRHWSWKLFGMHGKIFSSRLLSVSLLWLSNYRDWGCSFFSVSWPYCLWSSLKEIDLNFVYYFYCCINRPSFQNYTEKKAIRVIMLIRLFLLALNLFFLLIQVFFVREESISQVLFQRVDSSKMWSLPSICKKIYSGSIMVVCSQFRQYDSFWICIKYI